MTYTTATVVKSHHIYAAKLCKTVFEKKEDVMIEHNLDKKFIVIEGTDTLKNWIDNLSFMFSKNQIHRGFLRYANECIHKFNLFDHVVSHSDIVITGYSLGAAAAVIIGHFIMQQHTNLKIEIVIFGSPRIGGKEFVKEFHYLLSKCPNVNIVSFLNGNDIVSYFPCYFIGYRKLIEHYKLSSDSWNCFKNHKIQKYIEHLINDFSNT